MSGRIDHFAICVTVLCAIAVVTDLARGRIYNWLTLPALVAGIAVSAWSGGLTGFGAALAGTGLGLLAYGWMFSLGVMGGGDVKLLMALGAWGGPRFALETALLGVLVGGALALGILVAKGRISDFGRRVHYSILTAMNKELSFEAPKIDHQQTMPFGLAIAAAAIWIVWANPFVRFGVW